LASAKNEFISDWTPLLTRLGASVSARAKDGKLDRSTRTVALVVADRPPHALYALVNDARERGLPVVTARWIVQSVINGRSLSFGSFPA